MSRDRYGYGDAPFSVSVTGAAAEDAITNEEEDETTREAQATEVERSRSRSRRDRGRDAEEEEEETVGDATTPIAAEMMVAGPCSHHRPRREKAEVRLHIIPRSGTSCAMIFFSVFAQLLPFALLQPLVSHRTPSVHSTTTLSFFLHLIPFPP